MTDVEHYICEQIARAPYLDEETRTSWIGRIHADGLTPETTRLLLATMMDRALQKMGDSLHVAPSQAAARVKDLLSEIDRVESSFQARVIAKKTE
ncbi:MAG: hypothetical protein AAB416_02965 [Patescibacteria group bacterium]